MNSDVKVVEVLEKEIKSVVVDENENEEVSGDDQFKVSEPTIPVTNLFDALEEVKPILSQNGEACALGFKNADGGGTDDDVDKDDVDKDDVFKEKLCKIRVKLKSTMKASIQEKLSAKNANNLLSAEKITELENELNEEMENT